jgi:hypothetical protein
LVSFALSTFYSWQLLVNPCEGNLSHSPLEDI